MRYRISDLPGPYGPGVFEDDRGDLYFVVMDGDRELARVLADTPDDRERVERVVRALSLLDEVSPGDSRPRRG